MWWKVIGGLAAAIFSTPLLAKALGVYLNRRYAKRFPTDKSFESLPIDPSTDTVVFVHGLHGHFKNTWPLMPELLTEDPDLPQLDILLWGYRATIFPGARRLPDVGEALMSFVRDHTIAGTDIFFVGHSMGGLVILDGLSAEARAGRAAQRPAGATCYVVLYATPTNGAAAAAAIRNTVGRLPRIGYFFLNGHLKELGDGGYCDTLAGYVVNHLYNPSIAAGDQNYKVRIPIKACVGYHDEVVRKTSATFFLQHPAPSFFPTDTHSSVKEPSSRRDPRYKALHRPLADHFDAWFRRKAQAIKSGDVAARIEVLKRCRHAAMARLRARPSTGRESDANDRIEELLAIAVELATGSTPLGFGPALNLALEALVGQRR
jgi:pimeloyl-ACP methyl ester carboxylesterase